MPPKVVKPSAATKAHIATLKIAIKNDNQIFKARQTQGVFNHPFGVVNGK